MSDKYFVRNNYADCFAVKQIVDYLKGEPKPGTYPPGHPQAGQPIVSEQQRIAMTAAWWALTDEQREDPVIRGAWFGWELEWTRVLPEFPPGTRFQCSVPGEVDELIAEAALAGRTLSFAQNAIIQAAEEELVDTLAEVSWTEEP